jgi:HD-GYP domain-containing protein (c-di-GMP phosphodiesterase class II)
MLAAISRALEERDQTHGHGARVATLAEAVAQRLGWESERIATLRFGACLHDIGKLAVRRSILRKPGLLTCEEVAEIRAHPRAGASLILPLRGAWLALPYILFHHERWDGRGYPTGLCGLSIPLEARLLAVADAFDAMTSPRPYSTELSTEAALAEIRRCAGTQFDPAVAELFLTVWSDRSREASSFPAGEVVLRRAAGSGAAGLL